MLLIDSEATLHSQIQLLCTLEPRFADVVQQAGLPALSKRPTGFRQLYKVIVSQQLSVAAADSIWQRLLDAGVSDENSVLNTDEPTFKTLGLSKQKVRYVKSLATHHIDYAALAQCDDETVIDTLTQVTGIGQWTAEIYCLFSLQRSDIFPANDLALQAAAQALLQLPERPKEKTMRELAQQWSPHRSVAAYLLWRYYGYLKNRSGINA